MSGSVLTLENLVKRFGSFTAVNDLSFEISHGEIFGFLGPNGAGKTTTLRMILDIIQPTSGRISILGSPSAIPIRHRLGYLPEERGLYRKMKAVDTISYFARLRGLKASAAKKRALELLEEFGLKEFARSKNEALSKGMAQKVQLLATIAHDPEFLILDEPFSGFDPINQRTLEDLIRKLKADGKTIIFSTHVMEHAERLCDRFLIMAHGEKRFEGTLDEARRILPRKVIIRTESDVTPLGHVPGVLRIKQTGDGRRSDAPTYEVELTADADPQIILRESVARGIHLTRFEEGGASLHDIFVEIAGDTIERNGEIAA